MIHIASAATILKTTPCTACGTAVDKYIMLDCGIENKEEKRQRFCVSCSAKIKTMFEMELNKIDPISAAARVMFDATAKLADDALALVKAGDLDAEAMQELKPAADAWEEASDRYVMATTMHRRT